MVLVIQILYMAHSSLELCNQHTQHLLSRQCYVGRVAWIVRRPLVHLEACSHRLTAWAAGWPSMRWSSPSYWDRGRLEMPTSPAWGNNI